MPRPRFQKLPEERREQILETAAKEFAAHGFENASINRVLSAAGLSKGAAYYYFDDKADLFGTVARHYFEKLIGRVPLETPETPDAFWAWVDRIYRESMAEFGKTPWMLELAKSMWRMPRTSSGEPPFAEILQFARDWMREFVRTGQRVGAVRDDLPEELLLEIAMGIDSATDRWVADRWHPGENDEAIFAVTGKVWEVIRRMFEPPAAAAMARAPGAPPPRSALSPDRTARAARRTKGKRQARKEPVR